MKYSSYSDGSHSSVRVKFIKANVELTRITRGRGRILHLDPHCKDESNFSCEVRPLISDYHFQVKMVGEKGPKRMGRGSVCVTNFLEERLVRFMKSANIACDLTWLGETSRIQLLQDESGKEQYAMWGWRVNRLFMFTLAQCGLGFWQGQYVPEAFDCHQHRHRILRANLRSPHRYFI